VAFYSRGVIRGPVFYVPEGSQRLEPARGFLSTGEEVGRPLREAPTTRDLLPAVVAKARTPVRIEAIHLCQPPGREFGSEVLGCAAAELVQLAAKPGRRCQLAIASGVVDRVGNAEVAEPLNMEVDPRAAAPSNADNGLDRLAGREGRVVLVMPWLMVALIAFEHVDGGFLRLERG